MHLSYWARKIGRKATSARVRLPVLRRLPQVSDVIGNKVSSAAIRRWWRRARRRWAYIAAGSKLRKTCRRTDWELPAAARSQTRLGREETRKLAAAEKPKKSRRRNRSDAKQQKSASRVSLQERSYEEKSIGLESLSWLAAASQSRRHSVSRARCALISARSRS